MLNYNLAKIAASAQRREPGTQVLLPIIEGSLGAELSYLKVLRAFLREFAKVIRTDILPVAERELAQRRAALRITGDVEPGSFDQVRSFARALAQTATAQFRRILALEAIRHTKNFMIGAKRTLGIDLRAVVGDNDLDEYMATASARNAGLIQGLADDVIRRVSTSVTNAVTTGRTAKELRKQLTEDFGFGDRRAKVIARDQIAKVTSELNEIRHTQAGITEYTWRTSKDERVRPLHKKLDGLRYKYGKPTGAEQGLLPGRPILCRCIAQAVVTF